MGNLGEEITSMEILDIASNMRELLGAMFIQNQRIYDMLSIIADKLGADAKGLSTLHEQGQVLAPAPAFLFENSNSEPEV
jgi:hypothetical protein